MSTTDTNSPYRSFIAIQVSDDRMKAYLNFLIPSKANITAGDVMDLLNMEGIKYGVDQAAIERAVLAYKENPAENLNKNTLVSKGLPVFEGKDGYIEYYINEQPPVSIDEHGKADFRNIEKYKTVEKGKVIARVFRMIPGKDGYNVYGDTIKCPSHHDVKVNIGENVEYKEITNEIIATITGIYHKKKNTISVSQTLNIQGNVGLESGNLNYDGVIKVSGNVERGAEVTATGDIFIEGMIESGMIKTLGSLNVTGGINTKHEGCLHIKQAINTTYIENSTLECEGDLTILSSVVGSNIISCGSLHLLKDGSKIAGGEITVLKHIFTDNLGNVNETPTIINIGVHYFFNKEFLKTVDDLKELDDKIIALNARISEIKDYIQRMHGKISEEKKILFKNEFEHYKQTQVEVEQIKEKIERLKKVRFSDQDAFISIKDTIFPGVVIHYYGFIEKIIKPYKHCTLRFSKAEGRMIVETYREPPAKEIKK
ncbi:MAG: FapA family protein [Spirochaetia bacterium]|nr:FapA family protein [Spirochaetia bacterium]